MSQRFENLTSNEKPGLLGRAIHFKNLSDITETGDRELLPKIEDFEESPIKNDNASFLNKLKAFNDGIELPSQLFELIREELTIDGGALLLHDSSTGSFAPMANCNLDKTTLHRLRISREFIKSLPDGFISAITLEDEDLIPFKPLLSMRIFDALEKIDLYPFYDKNNLLGILLIFDSYIDTNVFTNTLNRISSPITELLMNSRFINLNRIGKKNISSKDDILSEIDKRIVLALSHNSKLTLILLDLSNILLFLGEKSKEIDLFRAKNDILSVLNTMVEDIGEVMNYDTDRVILIISSKTSMKNVILLNQIKLSLQSFFQSTIDFPALSAVIKRIPEDGMDSSIITNELN
ncbi:MAG: hypothetical protein JEY99_13500 [Spirochaetales bacterium]|nr:hypothetical protein [Spirochaetales bacterium]